jgi:hypothetical protein
MDSTTSRLADQAAVAERVRRRTTAARRRRFVRSAVLFLFLTAAMVLVSLAHRDSQAAKAAEQCRAWAEYAARELTAKYKGRMLPLLLPHREKDRERVRTHYHYEWSNDRHVAANERVGVCCCKQPHRFFLRPDGRHVILFDGEDFRVVWMTEDAFRERAAELRLPVSAGQ